MKKSFLLFPALLLALISFRAYSQGSTQPPAPVTPVISLPYQPANLSFQQYLQQNYQDQTILASWQSNRQNNNITRSAGSGMVTVFRELAYSHAVWNNSPEEWNNVDSARYGYSSNGVITGSSSVLFEQSNWNNFVTVSYAYNKDGKEVNYLNQNWDPTSEQWVYVSTSSYQYGNGNNCLSLTSSNWNTGNNNWLPVSMCSYGYDSAGNKISEIYQTWDSSSAAWVNSFNYGYTYSSTNQILTCISQIAAPGNTWQNSQEITYTYNPAGNVTAKTTLIWSGGNWVNYDMLTWSFDGNNNLTETASVIWDVNNSTWVNTAKSDYAYDASNNNTLEIDYSWNPGAYQWDSSAYKALSYNAGNYPVGEQDAVYINNVFTYTTRYINVYNANNNITFTVNYSWDKITNGWDDVSMVTYTYDTNHNPIYQLNQTWNNSLAEFENSEQYYYYYAPYLTTAVPEISNTLSATVYPNPSTSAPVNLLLNVQDNTQVMITIYDALGRPVNCELRQLAAGSNNIALGSSSLAAGNYLVQVVDRTNGKMSTLKLVKM